MKALNKTLIITIFMICLHTTNNYAQDPIKAFDLTKLPKTSNVKLSDLGFVDIEYIPLESKEQCMISRIDDIIFGDNYFLTHFSTNINMFKYDGTFAAKIGTEGRGPNEFIVVHDVDICRNDQNIYLADGWQKKFYVYSETGEFIKTFRAPIKAAIRVPIFAAISFRFTEDGILTYNMNASANVENSYSFIDTSGDIIKNFPNKYPWILKQKSTAIFEENLFYHYNSKLYKKEVYSDTIYVFENLNFKPHLVIEHGDKLLTTKARSDYEPRILFGKFISQKNLFEFGDYIYYEFTYGTIGGGNNTLKGFIGSKKDYTQFLINTEQGLINDLDGGPNILPKTIKDNNTLVSWIEALKLKKLVASQSFKNSTPKYPEKKKELERLANSLKETDNPVLIMTRLKK